ncbi:MAG: hypothetical protein NXI22_15010, partial [bacterium]|nr:hypothetical protein [bacterium]
MLLALLAFIGCSNGGDVGDPADGDPADGSAAVVEPPSARPQRAENSIDARFVNPRTHTAILFHTERMRKSPVYKNRLISLIDGYDHWVEELPTKYAMLLSDAVQPPTSDFSAESHWVVKFNGEFDMKQWLDSKFDDVKEEKALQKEFFSMTRGDQTLAAYAPDSETMIYGPSAKIRQLITMLPTPTDFAERLQHIDTDHDVCILFELTKQ